VDTIIVGTLDPEHLHENLRAVQRGPLPASIYAEVKHRLDLVGLKPADN
jgi:aryl-alcohol dehydrogenase-like predicted oxidoreductase